MLVPGGEGSERERVAIRHGLGEGEAKMEKRLEKIAERRMELQSKVKTGGETTETDVMVDGLDQAPAAAALAHGAGAHSVTRYRGGELGPTAKTCQGLVALSSSSVCSLQASACRRRSFSFRQLVTRQKHQLASSTLPFDHDRCCSCLALHFKHHRYLNIAFLP